VGKVSLTGEETTEALMPVLGTLIPGASETIETVGT